MPGTYKSSPAFREFSYGIYFKLERLLPFVVPGIKLSPYKALLRREILLR